MIAYLLILLGVLTRFLPHPPNFTAVAAVALFSGYYLKDKRIAMVVPLVIMFLSDWKIGFYQWQMMASVYLSFAVVVILGIIIRQRKWFFALPTSLVGSLIFFLVTNWAVWQFSTWYPHNFAGLTTCYLAGLPFLKNSLGGDLVYTLALFSLAELTILLASKTESKPGRLLLTGLTR